MCEASIHVPHRRATEKEQLVVRKLPSPMGHMRGLYPFKVASRELVCCRGLTKAIIKQVHFEKGMPMKLADAWEGKRNVKVTLRRASYQDVVEFPDGLTALIINLKEGTRIDIGIPVRVRKPKVDRTKKGMEAVASALHEIAVLPPDPKPEDHEEPAEEEKAPDEQREPAAPAARR